MHSLTHSFTHTLAPLFPSPSIMCPTILQHTNNNKNHTNHLILTLNTTHSLLLHLLPSLPSSPLRNAPSKRKKKKKAKPPTSKTTRTSDTKPPLIDLLLSLHFADKTAHTTSKHPFSHLIPKTTRVAAPCPCAKRVVVRKELQPPPFVLFLLSLFPLPSVLGCLCFVCI